MKRLVVLLPVLMAARTFASPQVGYAQATSYFKKDTRPTLYQPLNLLDAREATAWCSSGRDHLADSLSFGFKGIATIDEVRVYTGNGFDDKTFQEFSRAKKISLKSPSGEQRLSVADQRGLQAIALNPPLVGAWLQLDIEDVFPAEDPDNPTCVTDIVFYSNGKALNGRWMTEKLKYDRARAPLLGTWFGGHEGAPDRFLAFFFDGTYRYVHNPYDPANRGTTFGGEYEVRGNTLSLQTPKGMISIKMRRDKREDGRGRTFRTLSFSGGVPEDFKFVFRDRQTIATQSELRLE